MKKLNVFEWVKFFLWLVFGCIMGVLLSLALGAACSALIGCSSSPAKQEPPKVTITVRNDRDAILYGVITGGMFFRTVEVAPHSESSFWGYKSMVPDSITLTVTEKPAPARRK